MATFEEELEKIEPVVRRLCNFALLGKKIEVQGQENFVEKGPNIIVGNHIGSYKDIAILLKIVPRPIFFIANRKVFNREDFNFLIRHHLKCHLKDFGLFLDLVLKPIKSLFVNFISSNIGKVGTIPVDLTSGKGIAIEKCQENLKQGRAIIALQGYGQIIESYKNPFMSPFRKGASLISYNLYTQEDNLVPVTPVAVLGTQRPFLVPGRIIVKIGEPLYITDYFAGGFYETVSRFAQAMEERVNALILEIIRAMKT
ncbi:MAG: lysophospholipid acyltransferase family protein [Acidobacteriota bacterium]|nr:lysophospholipid acyltransferase family protein [Acidobacteriota bacterium]